MGQRTKELLEDPFLLVVGVKSRDIGLSQTLVRGW